MQAVSASSPGATPAATVRAIEAKRPLPPGPQIEPSTIWRGIMSRYKRYDINRDDCCDTHRSCGHHTRQTHCAATDGIKAVTVISKSAWNACCNDVAQFLRVKLQEIHISMTPASALPTVKWIRRSDFGLRLEFGGKGDAVRVHEIRPFLDAKWSHRLNTPSTSSCPSYLASALRTLLEHQRLQLDSKWQRKVTPAPHD